MLAKNQAWLEKATPPKQPFRLYPYAMVVDPALFFEKLRNELKHPSNPRYPGAVKDLFAVYKLEREKIDEDDFSG